MASPTAEGDAQKIWDETLTQLLNLSTTTVKRNKELEARVAELEVELSVWKQAHSTILDAAERDKRELSKRLAGLEPTADDNPLVLCVIDGDASIFTQALLRQGQIGGRQAAQRLTKAVAEYLTSDERVYVSSRLSFWITVYFNKRGLQDTLVAHNVCTTDDFEAFVMGFSQSSPRFLMVDVGFCKDAAGVKINEYLLTYARFSQTLRIFWGGANDTGCYRHTLAALQNDDALSKLVVLRGHNEVAYDHPNLDLPSFRVEDLFMTHKLSHLSRTQSIGSLPRTNLLSGFGSTGSSGSVTSPSGSSAAGGNSGKLIDPNLPLNKQNPPPCNEHYLMSRACSNGTSCKYSHEYVLTPEQLDILANNAKKAPCNYLKSGIPCPFGDRCCWGHVCPNGPKCFHLSKGKCWFKGDAMHSIGREGESP